MTHHLLATLGQISLLLIGTTIGVAVSILMAILIYEYRTISTRPLTIRPATIIVFGAHASDTGPSRELEHRLNHAIHLWQTGNGENVAVSGGYSDRIDETTAMSAYLEQSGVDARFIQEIRPGHSTQTTIQSIATLPINVHAANRWIAVSSGYHALRIRLWGWAYGLKIQVSCPRWQPWAQAHRWKQRLREVVAVLAISPSIVTIRAKTQH